MSMQILEEVMSGRERGRCSDDWQLRCGSSLEKLNNLIRFQAVSRDINKLNTQGLAPLHQAALDGNFAAVRMLLRYGANIDRQCRNGFSALHISCRLGNSDIVRYLLQRKANKEVLNIKKKRAYDLIDFLDFENIKLMLE